MAAVGGKYMVYNYYKVRANSVKNRFIVNGFRPETEKFDFGQTAYHQKGHVKRNRMVPISGL